MPNAQGEMSGGSRSLAIAAPDHAEAGAATDIDHQVKKNAVRSRPKEIRLPREKAVSRCGGYRQSAHKVTSVCR
jgi:hypothetical protein